VIFAEKAISNISFLTPEDYMNLLIGGLNSLVSQKKDKEILK
jgi:hypothetical protein